MSVNFTSCLRTNARLSYRSRLITLLGKRPTRSRERVSSLLGALTSARDPREGGPHLTVHASSGWQASVLRKVASHHSVVHTVSRRGSKPANSSRGRTTSFLNQEVTT